MTPHEKLETILASWKDARGEIVDVAEILPRASELWPDRTAYICQDDEITYRELYDASARLAQKLMEAGIVGGDRVIMYYANSIEFFIAYFSVWHIGAVVAPLNIFLSTEEFCKIINDATAKAVIISDEQRDKLTPQQLGGLPLVITTELIKQSRENKEIVVVPRITRNIHSVAAILYTSGTTGFPKGVMLSSYNILYNVAQVLASIEIDLETRVFCPLPLFHCLPQNICVWATCLVGATAITVAKIDRKSIISSIEKKPTIIIAVPAIYGLFCLLKNLNFDSVTYFASGADAISEKIRTGFELIYRRKIINGYGMTECAPFISAEIDDTTMKSSFVGEPFPGMSVEIRDEHNQKINSREIGVIWLKGANIMLGYYNAPEATGEILRDGWLNTGDLGRMVDGKIELCGRQKDLIINKGIKIYPQEVEQLLLTHPQVIAAAVLGQKVATEEVPVAFVAISSIKDAAQIEEELKELCKSKLAHYKIPRKFFIRSELPMNQTGKISKKILQEEL